MGSTRRVYFVEPRPSRERHEENDRTVIVRPCARSRRTYRRGVGTDVCARCVSMQAELRQLREENEKLRRENAAQKADLVDLSKLCVLQHADLERLHAERERSEPNRPEHLGAEELQLAFAEVVSTYGAMPAQNDGDAEDGAEDGDDDARTAQPRGRGKNKGKKRKRGGRRPLDTSRLHVEPVAVPPPPEVLANPSAWRHIGDETSDRLAHRPASYIVIRVVRPKYVFVGAGAGADAEEEVAATTSAAPIVAPERSSPRIICSDLPGWLWPRTMADVSAVTQVILSKYDMCLPLHRQERSSERCGFYLPRSTQCSWIETAYAATYRIVDAMMADARQAHCIATDATGAPIRVRGGSVGWHVFVFIADDDHVVFRPTRRHNTAAIKALLGDYRGHLLLDAATIYDALFKDGGLVEVSCWAHLRRYFWRARATEPKLATEALSILAKIFEVGRETWELPMPERTGIRARRVQPYLDLLDRWVDRVAPQVEPRSRLEAAFTYYANQHVSLRTFLRDGNLRLDNNISEQQLRNLVLGLHNWNLFETRAGLRWYCVFRSLIASCGLHGLEPQTYLDEVLRLAPHWSSQKMLQLAPRYWATTRAGLSDEHKAIISPPWLGTLDKTVSAA